MYITTMHYMLTDVIKPGYGVEGVCYGDHNHHHSNLKSIALVRQISTPLHTILEFKGSQDHCKPCHRPHVLPKFQLFVR